MLELLLFYMMVIICRHRCVDKAAVKHIFFTAVKPLFCPFEASRPPLIQSKDILLFIITD